MTDRRSSLRDESGFTLIELLVAAVILVIGIFGLISSVDSSRKLSDVSEREAIAGQVADRELEQAITLPYDSIALSTAAPSNGGAAEDDNVRWNFYLTSSSVLPQPAGGANCANATAATAASATPNNETQCIVACPTAATAGCVAVGAVPAVSNVSVPTASGTRVALKVYRYVTWVNDTACGTNCPNLAKSAYRGDYKRVTIAVQPVMRSVTATSGLPGLAAIEGPRQPIVVSAVKPDPSLGPSNNTGNVSPCSVKEAITC
jgi:prepilin-type N-terminal cleavage/methylation domain-containing protein